MNDKRQILSAFMEYAAKVARGSLIGYTQLIDRHYTAAPLHKFMGEQLEEVAAGRKRRLIINVPPRHGKSRLVTVEFPSWVLGHDPTKKIVLTSYSGDLATHHSKQARDRLLNPVYGKVFKTELHPNDQGGSAWSTTAGGIYKAVGVGGSLTGHGADLLIVDDPFKDHEEAFSPTIREKVWNWFLSVAMTRLAPGGSVVIIMTRWHPDDLVGRLLDPKRMMEQEDAVRDAALPWETISLPALAKDNDLLGRAPGEALDPRRYPVESILAIKATLTRSIYRALYDCDPEPEGGNYVDVSKVRVIEPSQVDPQARRARGWDLATSEKTQNDYTAGARGHFEGETMVVEHMARGHWNWPVAREYIKSLAISEKGMVGVEAQGGFKTAFSNLQEVCPPDVYLREIGATKDKLTRALPWFALIDNGKFAIVRGPWNNEFLSELKMFPAAPHDDQVDAVSILYETLKTKRVLLA